MRILITGGAGFVGSNLAMSLARHGAEVVVMDNLYRKGAHLTLPRLEAAKVRFAWGDVRDPQGYPAGPFDVVIECSAEPSVLAGQDGSPDYLLQTNFMGAYQCLEKARQWGSRFIFLSTSRVYPVEVLERHSWREEDTRFAWLDKGQDGITAQGVSEKTDLSPARSLYGFTKLAAELLILEYQATFGLKAVINRCGVIAGPWQFGKVDQGVASLWVLSHYFNRPLTYIGYGATGKQVRDILHIDDLCDLVQLQVDDPAKWDGWLGNVSGGLENSVSLQELTALCQEIIGHQVPITPILQNRPSDLRIYIGDCTKLREHSLWKPKRSVRQVITDIAGWVRDHEESLRSL